MLLSAQSFGGSSGNGFGSGGASGGNGGPSDDQIWSSDSDMDTQGEKHICPYIYPDGTMCGFEFPTRWARRRHQIASHGRRGRSTSQAWVDKRNKKRGKRKQRARLMNNSVTGSSSLLQLAWQNLNNGGAVHSAYQAPSPYQVSASYQDSPPFQGSDQVEHAEPSSSEPLSWPPFEPYPSWPLDQLESSNTQGVEPMAQSVDTAARNEDKMTPAPVTGPVSATSTSRTEMDPLELIDPHLIDHYNQLKQLPIKSKESED